MQKNENNTTLSAVASSNDNYQPPSIDLLDTPPLQENDLTEGMLTEITNLLKQTLNLLKIDATVARVSPGPVITRFELALTPDTQSLEITELSEHLANALGVSSVGVDKGNSDSPYIGLEVPNKQRQPIYFKDIISSEAFRNSQSPLPIALGLDISGKPQVKDLTEMKHVLIGAPRYGLSLPSILLLSLLYKKSPAELRLILVSWYITYDDIPHLLTPPISDVYEAERPLMWAVAEMERRYRLMAAMKVDKIEAFNDIIDDATARGKVIKNPLWEADESTENTQPPLLERLPFIVILIEELADLLMVVGKKVEKVIVNLAQKAHAVGIHLVVMTRRFDVISDSLKTNIPTHIDYQVSSYSPITEEEPYLIDIIYKLPESTLPKRCYVSVIRDNEVGRVTDYLRSIGKPQYIDGITWTNTYENVEDPDPLYEEAVKVVLETDSASISKLQRHFRIGYNRTARMIEKMQEQGIVSEPVNGIRRVLR